MARHRIQVVRPFRFEYRLPAPMEVRFNLFRMNSKRMEERLSAVSALVRLGDPTAVETLMDALEEDLPLRLFAAEAIALLLPQAPRLNPHAPDETRRRELDALRQWWSKNRQKVLDEWLVRRLVAAGYIEDRPPPGRLVEALLAALNSDDLVLRFHAHRRLKELFGEIAPYQYNWPTELREEAAERWREQLKLRLRSNDQSRR